MKLAIVASHPIQYHAPLYRLLAESGVDVLALYCRDGVDGGKGPAFDPEFGRAFAWDRPLLDGYRHAFLPNLAPKAARHRAWGLWNPAVTRALERERPDAVLLHASYWAPTVWLAQRWAARRGVPVLYRAETVLREDPPVRAAAKRAIVRRFLGGVDACLTIGAQSERFYLAHGFPRERLHRTPYAVDNAFFVRESDLARAARDDVLRSIGLPPERPVVLLAGKLVPRKRPMDAVEAMGRVATPASLLVVGDGSERAAVESRARELGVTAAFVGFQNQSTMPRWYGASDVFVIPSNAQEVSPLAINEAMCAALPVVASDAIPSAAEFVEDGTNGRVVPFADVGRLAEALDGLLADDDARKRMGQASRERIAEWSYETSVHSVRAAVAAGRRSNRAETKIEE